MKTLVIGASGKFAKWVVPELTKRGVTVRALVRDTGRGKVARQNGASETAIGDLNDEKSLRLAVAGVDAVFHINPAFAPNEEVLGMNMVRAAKVEGVKRFVFSGVIHPALSKLTNHVKKNPVEEAIYESGMTYTVLQPTMFMQNLDAAWPRVVQKNRFGVPYSKLKKASYVDYRDVAEAAALALATPSLDNGTFELCSAGLFTRGELVQFMSEALGRAVEATEPAFEEWAKDIPHGPLREGLRRMYENYDAYGFPGGNALVLRSILGREPRTLRAYVHELARRTATPQAYA